MPSRTPRRRSSGRTRLAVTVTAPDAHALPTRGLATWLANAAPAGARGEVTVALVSDARMRTLNRSYRNKDYATDVLSFPAYAKASAGKPTYAKASAGKPAFAEATAGKPAVAKASASATASADKTAGKKAGKTVDVTPHDSGYLGDIVIATGVAQRQADEVGHSVATELKVLALHGLLHLLGYDHETDDGTMARVEARLRRKAGLDRGLIARQSR